MSKLEVMIKVETIKCEKVLSHGSSVHLRTYQRMGGKGKWKEFAFDNYEGHSARGPIILTPGSEFTMEWEV